MEVVKEKISVTGGDVVQLKEVVKKKMSAAGEDCVQGCCQVKDVYDRGKQGKGTMK